MAKNYTLKDLAAVLNQNEMTEETIEVLKRFPKVSLLVVKTLGGCKDSTLELLNAMPDYLTANKLNKAIDENITEDDEEVVEETEETPVKVEKPTKKAKKEVVEDDAVDEDVDDEAEEASNDTGEKSYQDMEAIELYKLAKSRGLNPEPKKTQKHYIWVLEKADRKEAREKVKTEKETVKAKAEKTEKKVVKEEVAEDDDWGDEEEAKPVKKAKAKKVEVEEDEDDDWDI